MNHIRRIPKILFFCRMGIQTSPVIRLIKTDSCYSVNSRSPPGNSQRKRGLKKLRWWRTQEWSDWKKFLCVTRLGIISQSERNWTLQEVRVTFMCVGKKNTKSEKLFYTRKVKKKRGNGFVGSKMKVAGRSGVAG